MGDDTGLAFNFGRRLGKKELLFGWAELAGGNQSQIGVFPLGRMKAPPEPSTKFHC